ncbi:Mitogen-activated protein kinase kinase 1 [Hondaea fermentalgiana]|uniref:mitogen-activated protein kinase kinase n=1 Tax=Hondaea fermentalgiana TaxID=2315210 RepID=A0A2R5GP08_9STRA|nr:Mitogen-activated protein kinase kinase 1 [Hondaea fermentalgiana]|eukprot:GBG30363.1 Mitogen-activated protein kinase kinase 1 [Hondaea fermentalgiana]
MAGVRGPRAMDEAMARWRAAAARAAVERTLAAPAAPVATQLAESCGGGSSTPGAGPAQSTKNCKTPGLPQAATSKAGKMPMYEPTNVSLAVAQRSASGHEARTEIVLPRIDSRIELEDEPRREEELPKSIQAPGPLLQAQAPARQIRDDASKQEQEASIAYSFKVTETGSLNIQGFEIQESGITRAPSGVLPSLSTRDGLIRLSILGRGASGVVYEMLHEPTFSLVAVKSIPCFEQGKRKQMIKELKALYANLVPIRTPGSATTRNASRPVSAGAQPRDRGDSMPEADTVAPAIEQGPACPYIVAFHDAFVNPQEGSVNIVMEYMDGGSLQDVVSAGGCDSEDVLSVVTENVARGLLFLHNRRQIHRDIKPSNLLLNGKGEVKISDFGIVRDVSEDQTNVNTFVGTMVYMSPERINGEPYSFASDVWSLGLTLMTCALGAFPFREGGSYWDMLHSINNDPIPQLPADQFSPAFADLVNQCLQKDPAKRPTAAEILCHPFVAERLSNNQPSPQTEQAPSTARGENVQHSSCSAKDAVAVNSATGNACKSSPRSTSTYSPRPESSPARPGSARTPSTATQESHISVESKEKLEEICSKLVEYQLGKVLEANQRRSKAREALMASHGASYQSGQESDGADPVPNTSVQSNHALVPTRRRKRAPPRRRAESTPSLAEMGKCSCSFKGNKCSFCMTTTLGPHSQPQQAPSGVDAIGNVVPFNLRKYAKDECARIANQIGVDAVTVRQRVNAHVARANEFLRRSRLYAS